ncbi:hypothetical protein BJ165DRAFT_1535563 [Panaeolus papilionaceus]|nr:hypothetical protein BJ165DRAFT_1535563 [Panaeolus papilionaceus]
MASTTITLNCFLLVLNKVQSKLPAAFANRKEDALVGTLAAMATDLDYLQSCLRLGITQPAAVAPDIKAYWKKTLSVSWIFWVALDFENLSVQQGTQDKKSETDVSSKLAEWRTKKAACDKLSSVAAPSSTHSPSPAPAPTPARQSAAVGSHLVAARTGAPARRQVAAAPSNLGAAPPAPLSQVGATPPAPSHAPPPAAPTSRAPTITVRPTLNTNVQMRTSPHGRPVPLIPSPLTAGWTSEETTSKRKDIDEAAPQPPTPGGGKRIQLDPEVANIAGPGAPSTDSADTSAAQTARIVRQPTTPASSLAASPTPNPRAVVEVVVNTCIPKVVFKDGHYIYVTPCSNCSWRDSPCVRAANTTRCEHCVKTKDACDYASDRKQAGKLGSQKKNQAASQSGTEGSQPPSLRKQKTSTKETVGGSVSAGDGEQTPKGKGKETTEGKRKTKKDDAGTDEDDDDFQPSNVEKKEAKKPKVPCKVTMRALQEHIKKLEERVEDLEERVELAKSAIEHNSTVLGRGLQSVHILCSEVGNALLGLGQDVTYAVAMADQALGPNVMVDQLLTAYEGSELTAPCGSRFDLQRSFASLSFLSSC